MPTFLATSATGCQGGSTACLLLAQGAKSLGATLFKGDFDDVPTITGIFLNPFPNFFTDPASEARTTETFVAAVRAAGTAASIVLSTIYGANRYADWDAALRPAFPLLVHTTFRSTWRRVLTVSCPRGFRLDHLDAVDVGQFAAAALLDPARFAGTEIELVGERLTLDEVAAHLAAAVGAEVTVRYHTEEETAEVRKTLPTVETQIWAPTVERLEDTAELARYGFRLTTFKEFFGAEERREKDGGNRGLGRDL
ncbi:hypothetical protein B0H17DRAFT_1198576 [Mycena rosella]|uniref:NmrA-like domain-containing protein n=1 Tax=Mycena rosella TaxID=1033263 RepID=A0AAD7GNA1_MYCRO|nr:hypothetical protein B0H17DRAFT_1198576 [Mycena rosella]